jgi:hypothetical protein
LLLQQAQGAYNRLEVGLSIDAGIPIRAISRQNDITAPTKTNSIPDEETLRMMTKPQLNELRKQHLKGTGVKGTAAKGVIIDALLNAARLLNRVPTDTNNSLTTSTNGMMQLEEDDDDGDDDEIIRNEPNLAMDDSCSEKSLQQHSSDSNPLRQMPTTIPSASIDTSRFNPESVFSDNDDDARRYESLIFILQRKYDGCDTKTKLLEKYSPSDLHDCLNLQMSISAEYGGLLNPWIQKFQECENSHASNPLVNSLPTITHVNSLPTITHVNALPTNTHENSRPTNTHVTSPTSITHVNPPTNTHANSRPTNTHVNPPTTITYVNPTTNTHVNPPTNTHVTSPTTITHVNPTTNTHVTSPTTITHVNPPTNTHVNPPTNTHVNSLPTGRAFGTRKRTNDNEILAKCFFDDCDNEEKMGIMNPCKGGCNTFCCNICIKDPHKVPYDIIMCNSCKDIKKQKSVEASKRKKQRRDTSLRELRSKVA